LEKDYPTIEGRAKVEKAEIRWSDEIAMNKECNYCHSYSPKGISPEIRRNACRFSKSMLSSIVSNQGTIRFMCYDGALNADYFFYHNCRSVCSYRGI